MPHQTKKPALGGGRDFGFGIDLQASSNAEDTLPVYNPQAAVWLARRARVSIPHASVLAELNQIGGRRW